MDTHDYACPPPAYNDEEFDRKTSLAAEASLQQAPPPAPEISEERWAEIEEAAFQAAIAASLAEAEGKGIEIQSAGQSSRSIEPGPPSPSRSRSPATTLQRLPTSTKPLRIEKKGKISVDLKNEKEKPKWLHELENEGASSSSSQAETSVSGHARHESYDAPPPFVEVAPEGSEYNEPTYHDIGYDPPHSATLPSVASSPELSPNSQMPNLDTLSLSSMSSPASDYQPAPYQPPASTLPQAPPHHHHAHYQAAPQPPAFNEYRQSMPVSPSQEPLAHRPELQRPRSFTPQHTASHNHALGAPYNKPTTTAPMMPFNPSVAYGKSPFARLHTPPPSGMEEPKQQVVYRANAFYNAAVSAHLTAQTPQRPAASDQRSIYSNESSYKNSYSNSCSTASSPGYRNMNTAGPAQHHPYTAAPTPTDPNWGQAYPGNNRPMSVYSTDSVYSSSSVGQPYLNTFQQIPQQHSGGPPSNWGPAQPQQYQSSRYGQW